MEPDAGKALDSIKIYTDYGKDMGDTEKNTWKHYGAPKEPIPRRGILEKILRNMTEDDEVEEIEIPPSSQGGKIGWRRILIWCLHTLICY